MQASEVRAGWRAADWASAGIRLLLLLILLAGAASLVVAVSPSTRPAQDLVADLAAGRVTYLEYDPSFNDIRWATINERDGQQSRWWPGQVDRTPADLAAAFVGCPEQRHPGRWRGRLPLLHPAGDRRLHRSVRVQGRLVAQVFHHKPYALRYRP